ncbi:DUF4202 domain-containing protein [Aliagarivorans marinus]|uniref:DUF4202 domain-containing protein n=1 Tax=Aliagarivorans marinus TaxID=561965 RepID=UPI00040914C4|nr:DUF4202 domain-containing protein [Aliagarivorans marinus]
MNAQQNFLQAVLDDIDLFNQQDPNIQLDEQGDSLPKELLYGQRMSAMLEQFGGDELALQIAARAQHIGRWLSPRSDYPEGKKGYLQWRKDLGSKHAQLCCEILDKHGADGELQQQVTKLLTKQGIKRDPLVQALEDVICLVFLRYYFEEFAAKHDDDKVVDIVRKTWAKMSERGQQHALTLPLSESSLALVQKALNIS